MKVVIKESLEPKRADLERAVTNMEEALRDAEEQMATDGYGAVEGHEWKADPWKEVVDPTGKEEENELQRKRAVLKDRPETAREEWKNARKDAEAQYERAQSKVHTHRPRPAIRPPRAQATPPPDPS